MLQNPCLHVYSCLSREGRHERNDSSRLETLVFCSAELCLHEEQRESIKANTVTGRQWEFQNTEHAQRAKICERWGRKGKSGEARFEGRTRHAEQSSPLLQAVVAPRAPRPRPLQMSVIRPKSYSAGLSECVCRVAASNAALNCLLCSVVFVHYVSSLSPSFT